MEVKFGPDLTYFLCSLALGIILAALYDILRFTRKVIRTSDIVVNIQDILFIVASGGLIAAAAYLANNGCFRVYSVFSVALGFGAYRAVVQSRVVRLLTVIYGGICRVVKFMAKILLFPLKTAVRLIGKPLIVTVGSAAGRVRRRRIRKPDENIE